MHTYHMHIDISDPINNAEKTCQTVLNISYGLLARARHLCQLLLARHNWNQRKLIRRKLNGHIRVLVLVCVSVCTYKFITPALPVCTHFIYIYWTTCKNTHTHTHTIAKPFELWSRAIWNCQSYWSDKALRRHCALPFLSLAFLCPFLCYKLSL